MLYFHSVLDVKPEQDNAFKLMLAIYTLLLADGIIDNAVLPGQTLQNSPRFTNFKTSDESNHKQLRPDSIA